MSRGWEDSRGHEELWGYHGSGEGGKRIKEDAWVLYTRMGRGKHLWEFFPGSSTIDRMIPGRNQKKNRRCVSDPLILGSLTGVDPTLSQNSPIFVTLGCNK